MTAGEQPDLGPDDIAEALFGLYPPAYDPGDITTWPVDQLDQLAEWDILVRGGDLTFDPPDGNAPHVHTPPGHHDYTGNAGDPDTDRTPDGADL